MSLTDYDMLYDRVQKYAVMHHKIHLGEPISVFMRPEEAVEFFTKIDNGAPNPTVSHIKYTINPDKYKLHLYSINGPRNLYVKLYDGYQTHPTLLYPYIGWAVWGLQ